MQSESDWDLSYTQKMNQQKFQASFGRLPSQQSENNEIFDYLHPNELQDEWSFNQSKMYDEYMEQKKQLEVLTSKVIPLKDREIEQLKEELSKKLTVIQDLERDMKRAEQMMHGIKYSLTDCKHRASQLEEKYKAKENMDTYRKGDDYENIVVHDWGLVDKNIHQRRRSYWAGKDGYATMRRSSISGRSDYDANSN